MCQATDGLGHLCHRPVRTTGVGLIRNVPSLMYECDTGHRFALTDSPGMRPIRPDARRGELDGPLVSGESETSHEAGGSGESGISHEPRRRSSDSLHTDSRRVTIIPRERPVFGERQ